MMDETNVIKDARQLLSIFPQEIWLMIAESLKKGIDWTRLSNSSPFFRNALSPSRTVFLFPKVWEIFGPSFELNMNKEFIQNYRHNQDNPTPCNSCGRNRPIIPYSEILKLRLVCTSWRKAIDKEHKHDVTRFDFEGQPNDFNWRLQTFDSVQGGPDYFHQFHRHFGSITTAPKKAKGSPLFANAIAISHGYQSAHEHVAHGQHIYNEIPNFLKKYGKHVIYCNIRIWFGNNFANTYTRLNAWLSRMPNVKSLELDIVSKSSLEGFGLPGPTTQQLEELRQVVGLVHFPHLEKLKYVKLKYCPPYIFYALLRANRQVTRVKLSPDSDIQLDELSLGKHFLQSIKKLSITVHWKYDFDKLEALLAKYQLRELHLDIDLGEGEYIGWRKVFRRLRLCAESLKVLELKLPEDDCKSSLSKLPTQLELRKVSVLKLTLPAFTSLDFILPMKHSLNLLVITVPREDKDLEKAMARKTENLTTIKFFTFLDNPKESNLWRIFPKLKCVCFFELVEIREHPWIEKELMWCHRRGF